VRFAAVLFILLTMAAFSQTLKPENQLDGNETLFTVLAAINAAGYDAEIDSVSKNSASTFRMLSRWRARRRSRLGISTT
jgi:hypothetical protein